MSTMTDDRLRIAVAEANGYFPMGHPAGRPWWGRAADTKEPHRANKFFFEALPDYPSDLNACAEFEGTLPSENQLPLDKNIDRYRDHLIDECGSVNKAFNATARQRCLAYLATVAPEKLLP